MRFCANAILAGFGHAHPLLEVVTHLALFLLFFQCCGTQMYYFLVIIDPVMLSDLCLGIWAVLACSHRIICILCKINKSSLKSHSPGQGQALYDGFGSAWPPLKSWALKSWAKAKPAHHYPWSIACMTSDACSANILLSLREGMYLSTQMWVDICAII